MYTDGGRSVSKHPNNDNDCAIVAVATACGWSYDETYALLYRLGFRASKGFEFPTGKVRAPSGPIGDYWFQMFNPDQDETIGQFIRANPRGTWLVGIYGHIFCVKNGVLWDHTKHSQHRVVKEIWGVYKMPNILA